jgi:hypothetical protein
MVSYAGSVQSAGHGGLWVCAVTGGPCIYSEAKAEDDLLAIIGSLEKDIVET